MTHMTTPVRYMLVYSGLQTTSDHYGKSTLNQLKMGACVKLLVDLAQLKQIIHISHIKSHNI